MRLLTYRHDHAFRLGAVVKDVVHDLTDALDVADVGDLLRGPGVAAARYALATARAVGPWTEVDLYPPVLEPRRILCVGANYVLHQQEMGHASVEHPTLFVRFPSSLVGHRQSIVRPRASERFDFEGELAVVIGQGGRHIAEDDALDHVAGYACFDDGSVRDYQRHTKQFTPGKNFDRSGGFGPWMVTVDEVPDPHDLTLETRLNGEVMQQGRTGDVTFRIPRLIAYASTFTTLEPGDVIATGTPDGVGDKRTPPVYLKAGDRLEVEISKVGCLSLPVVDEV